MLPVLFLLTIATAAVYGQVWNFGFINYDGPLYVTDNAMVRKGLSWEGLRWALTALTAANWHPLTWLAHMLDVSLFGLEPGFHHLVNLLFHLLNTALLFLVLKAATGACWRSAFVAALFALHPLHVESVAWIAERKDVLSTFFGLLAIGAYCRYARSLEWRKLLPVAIFFSLGLMAKPMLVTLPLVLLLMDFWPLGRLKPSLPEASSAPAPSDERKKSKKKRKQEQAPAAERRGAGSPHLTIFTEKIPLILLSALSGLITLVAQHQGGAISAVDAYPLGTRIANALASYLVYLVKMIWPANLAVYYPFVKDIPAWQALAGALLLIAVTFAAVRAVSRFPYLLFGWLWYLITLLPVIGIVKVGETAMADRYTYITLVGPFVAATWAAHDLAAGWTRGKAALAAAGLLVMIALAAATFTQAGTWKSSATLFRHALAVTENNFMAHTNLAVALMDEGRLDEALAHLETAAKIRPDFPNARYNLGVIRMRQGKNDEAMGHFKAALHSDPNFARASHYGGLLHLQRGESAEAVQYFQRALAGGGPDPQVFAALADALAMSSRYEEALYSYERALTLNPDAAEIRYNASRILIAMGRVDEAIGHLREAVRIRPDYARAHNNLGSALLMKKRLEEAVYHFREAVRIDPGYKMARENLKDALAQQKKERR
jgi:tetratricopeptide (TPR) repeat protein